MGHGLDRREIFLSLADYQHFAERLGLVLIQGGAQCLAWSLMPNHYHLLLRTGDLPLTRLMARQLTSYTLGFNHRHGRQGYLFQGRYKSILCEEEPYLLELVRYIHLNPVRAGLVPDVDKLRDYPWCGHGVLVGEREAPWQDVGGVLSRFGSKREGAIAAYRKFMAEGVGLPRPVLGPVRGAILRRGGEWEFDRQDEGTAVRNEERVEGDDAFVHAAVAGEQELEARRSVLRRDGWTPPRVIARAAEVCGVSPDAVYGAGKRPGQVRARALACKWLIEDLGISGAKVARSLRIAQSTVSEQAARGRVLASQLGHRLEERGPGGRIR
jgi:REP element-mobilizing transposase RayT